MDARPTSPVVDGLQVRCLLRNTTNRCSATTGMTVASKHARCGRRPAAWRRLAAPGQSETSMRVAERFACRPRQTCSFEGDEQLRGSESRQSHLRKYVRLSAFNSAFIDHAVSLWNRELLCRGPLNGLRRRFEISRWHRVAPVGDVRTKCRRAVHKTMI